MLFTSSLSLKQSCKKNQLLYVAGLSWLFDAMDVGLLSFILVAIKLDWGLSTTQLGWIGSVNSIGMAIGAFAFGLYSDKRGRKSAFIITLLLFSIASGLSAFAWGLTSLLVLRFFIGLGLGGELPVASTLVSEHVSANQRGRVIVLLESFWAFGWILAAIIAFFLIPQPYVGWRGAMLLCAIPAFYALYLRVRLPDIPKNNSAARFFQQESVWQKTQRLWAASFRKQTAVLWIVWFCVVFSYYGMFLWLPSVMLLKGFSLMTGFGYVLLMSIAQLPGYYSAAWLIEVLGRKFVLVAYLLGTMVGGYFFGVSHTTTELLISGALLSFFNLGAWGALYAYTPEHYPAAIRTTGAGFAAGIGRIGGILGPLSVGYLLAAHWNISAIFSFFCIVIVVAIVALLFWGKETKGVSLS